MSSKPGNRAATNRARQSAAPVCYTPKAPPSERWRPSQSRRPAGAVVEKATGGLEGSPQLDRSGRPLSGRRRSRGRRSHGMAHRRARHPPPSAAHPCTSSCAKHETLLLWRRVEVGRCTARTRGGMIQEEIAQRYTGANEDRRRDACAADAVNSAYPVPGTLLQEVSADAMSNAGNRILRHGRALCPTCCWTAGRRQGRMAGGFGATARHLTHRMSAPRAFPSPAGIRPPHRPPRKVALGAGGGSLHRRSSTPLRRCARGSTQPFPRRCRAGRTHVVSPRIRRGRHHRY
jgi:hypothetical protein